MGDVSAVGASAGVVSGALVTIGGVAATGAVVLPGVTAAGQSMVIDPMTPSGEVGSFVVVFAAVVGAVGGAVDAGLATPVPPPVGTGVALVEDARESDAPVSVEPVPRSAIAGTAQALVPANSDTPTAAAMSRPAAAGAMVRNSNRPHRPGAPGSRPTTAANHTTSTHPSSAQTSTDAATRIAVSAVAPIASGPGVPVATALNWPAQLSGRGSTTASASRPTKQPRSWSIAERAPMAPMLDGWPLHSDDRQSVHLTSFAMCCSEMEQVRVCQVALASD